MDTEVQRRLDEILERLQALEGAIGDTRALAARAYETQLGWDRQLAVARSAPDYEEPYTVDEPLVSVRISTWNNAEILVDRTLSSLRAQTYDRWEAIVVGDALTDDTERRIARMRDPRIRFVNLAHRGPNPPDPHRAWLVSGSRPANAAVRLARGHWIAPLDHDDEFTPDHIETLLTAARRERAEVTYGRLQYIDAATGRPLPVYAGAWPPTFAQFAFQGALVHRALRGFEYDPLAYLAGEPADWNLGRRLWEVGARFSFVDRVVTRYWFVARSEAAESWLRDRLAEADAAPDA